MPRARNIKYEFFTNEKLAELPFEVRLLFIGLWTLADKEGRLEERPKKIKALLFPYDDNINVMEMLQKLHEYNFITRYPINEDIYIQINNFKKHQNPHKNEKDSILPQPPVTDCKIDARETSRNYPSTSDKFGNARADSLLLIPDSLLLIPDCVNENSEETHTHKNEDFLINVFDEEIKKAWVAYGVLERSVKDKIVEEWLILFNHHYKAKKYNSEIWFIKWKDWCRMQRIDPELQTREVKIGIPDFIKEWDSGVKEWKA